jgi:hypothetical protein
MFTITVPLPRWSQTTCPGESFPVYITTHRAGSHSDGEPTAAAVSPSVLSSDPTSIVTFLTTYQIISIQSFISFRFSLLAREGTSTANPISPYYCFETNQKNKKKNKKGMEGGFPFSAGRTSGTCRMAGSAAGGPAPSRRPMTPGTPDHPPGWPQPTQRQGRPNTPGTPGRSPRWLRG